MAAHLLSQDITLPSLESSRRTSQLDITIQTTINADPRRIFHALTMPEYLEVWMSLPEPDAYSGVVALRNANSYRIDFYRSENLDASITGLFRIYKADKLVLTWRKFGVSDDAQSIVNILLQGGIGRCILELRHTGLPSYEESVWHQSMWRTSLRNLAQLF